MWYMHRQTVNNLFGLMGRWFPWAGPFSPFGSGSDEAEE